MAPRSFALVALLMLPGAVACQSPSERADDAAIPADGGPWYPDDLPVMAWGRADPANPARIDPASATPPDLSCLGTGTAPPSGGPMVVYDLPVVDFLNRDVVPMPCARAFFGGSTAVTDVPDTVCDAAAVHGDATGHLSLSIPQDGLIAIETYPIDDPDPAFAYIATLTYRLAPVPTQVATSISRAAANTIPIALGRELRPGSGFIGSAALDCSSHFIYGLVMRLADADGHYLFSGPQRTDQGVAYSNGRGLPQPDGRWTHVDGLAIAFNVAALADGRPLFVELWGRRSAGAAPELIACEAGRVLSDGATELFDTRPVRADGPACPGLR